LIPDNADCRDEEVDGFSAVGGIVGKPFELS
jgi:hypothetical protein